MNDQRSIDWKEIHRRMEKTQLTIERGWSPTPEEKKKILKTRAKALAQEPEKKETVDKYIEVVEFLLSYEKYAIESSYVREIYPLKELTNLPCTPPFILGIVNVHGQIISVIDIKKFFELPEKGLSDLNKVIILRSEGPALSRVEGMEFGILADVILGVRRIPLTDSQPSLPTLTGIREEYLKGVTGEQVVILDAEKLLSDKKIAVHEKV
jgi:purine-binding chemotaxis protein CheW